MTPLLVFSAVVAALLAAAAVRANLRRGREDFIDAYAFPPGVWQRVRKRYPHLTDAQLALVQRHGSEPFPDEIATELGLPVGKVREGLRTGLAAISLDQPIGGDDGISILEQIEDDSEVSPFQQAAQRREAAQTARSEARPSGARTKWAATSRQPGSVACRRRRIGCGASSARA